MDHLANTWHHILLNSGRRKHVLAPDVTQDDDETLEDLARFRMNCNSRREGGTASGDTT